MRFAVDQQYRVYLGRGGRRLYEIKLALFLRCFLSPRRRGHFGLWGYYDQWRENHWERSHAHQQPRDQCLKDGGQYSTGERQLFRGVVPPISDSAGASGGEQSNDRKLARLVYRMPGYGMKYVDQGAEFYEAQHRKQQVIHLKRKAAQLGLQIIELAAAA
jgi:hypothetical protein